MLSVSRRASKTTFTTGQPPLYMQMTCNKTTLSILERVQHQPSNSDYNHSSGGLYGRTVSDTMDIAAPEATKRGTHDRKRTTCTGNDQIRRRSPLCGRRRGTCIQADREGGKCAPHGGGRGTCHQPRPSGLGRQTGGTGGCTLVHARASPVGIRPDDEYWCTGCPAHGRHPLHM